MVTEKQKRNLRQSVIRRQHNRRGGREEKRIKEVEYMEYMQI